MLARFIYALVIVSALRAGDVIDRIAVIAGKHVIKASDIDRDLRVTDFLNRVPVNFNATAKRQSADRLIDQQIIRDEVIMSSYNSATDADAEAMVEQLRKERYAGSDARLRQDLTRYGLTEDQLRVQLLWQLTVLRFIDQRFRPAALVTDEEVRAWYDQHLTDLKRQNPHDNSFDTLAPKIRSSLEGERINQQFETWLKDARGRARIEYREGAFQ
jgi:hypothetical protein